ncbi:MAG: hypothetical protein H0T51_15430 [Pirellulales bacterium]|nr:hypothetical protein [Pirellulales bacterium]
MTDTQLAQARSIVNEVVAAHFTAFAQALRPVFDAIGEMQKSLGLLLDGQALVEKTLAGAFSPSDDNEPWRESLDDSDN